MKIVWSFVVLLALSLCLTSCKVYETCPAYSQVDAISTVE